jgi:DNA-binding NtrC family response regulator
MGYRVEVGATGADLKRLLLSEPYDAVILDVHLPDADGVELLQEVHRHDPQLPIILATAHATVEQAVSAVRLGAYDYIEKPIDFTRLEIQLKNAVGSHQLTRKVRDLETTLSGRRNLGEIIGADERMQLIYSVIENVSQSDATVFITGESGTGKELVARAIHSLSPRGSREMVDLNCAAIPDSLLESELFGYEQGAFTGAMQRYIGCCERAHRSTLFLDEICEMSFPIQAKLLRFTQERNFYRLGGRDRIQVDCRIIAATNKDPLEQVRQNRFREDLYHRINVVPVYLPPLRERKDDIPVLAEHFLHEHSARNHKDFRWISSVAMDILCQYDWPGNVRELENVIAQAVVLHDGLKITEEMILPRIRGQDLAATGAKSRTSVKPMWQREKEAIEEALQVFDGRITATCDHLQMSRATLYRKLRKYDIKRPRYYREKLIPDVGCVSERG